jgi:SAM-dependent methyltransferase
MEDAFSKNESRPFPNIAAAPLESIASMRQFAETAMIHARQKHDLPLDLSPQGIAVVDTVLDRERQFGDADDFGSLALCYGSWLGEVGVRRFGACWAGMHEPHPPRLSIGGVLCSPIDAVARRLQDASEPRLSDRWHELQAWANDCPPAEAARSQNRQAWDDLCHDPRFVQFDGRDDVLPDRETVEAAIDPWLQDLPRPSCELLCLAAGGGTHSLLHALAGFRVTVVDISPRMLAVDQRLAAVHRLAITTVHASMDDLSALEDARFDAVVQPVSACYVPDLLPVYAEVARVLRDGGRYVVQHKQPASMQASGTGVDRGYRVVHPAFDGRPVGPVTASNRHLEPGAAEFIHPLDTLLGGLCRSGFVIEDFQEPPRADAWAAPGSDAHRACYVPPYFKIKARRTNRLAIAGRSPPAVPA